MGEPAIRFIEPPEANPRLLAVEISGRFTADDMRDFLRRLDEATAGGEKVLLYEDISGYDGFDFDVVTEKLKHFGKIWRSIEKIALVGDARWLELYAKIIDPVTPQQIRHFTTEEKDRAFAWLVGD